MHLADNARVAMPNGGRLQISTTNCPIAALPADAALEGQCAVLTVTDTGTGMDEAVRHRIFEPFFSTKNTTLTTGLGLSTVHGIISQSKGHIDCQSIHGVGTTFRIFLPSAAGQPCLASVPPDGPNAGFHILLAEDDPIVNKHLTFALKQAGFSVDSAFNGEEALAAFATDHYHLLVTDIIMPKLGGVELTQRLRKLAPTLPVVLISGYTEEVSILRNLPQDQIAYLQKPFASPELINLLRSLLAKPAALLSPALENPTQHV